MNAIFVDQTTITDEYILQELDSLPHSARVRHPRIPYDRNGVPIGYTLKEAFDRIDENMSEAYGVDFKKLVEEYRCAPHKFPADIDQEAIDTEIANALL